MPLKKSKQKNNEVVEQNETSKSTKKKKQKSKVRKIIEWVCTGILILLIGGCSFVLIYSRVNAGKDPKNPNAPIAIGNTYLPVIVLTDSMEPKYPVGSAIFINKIDPSDLYQKYLTWDQCENPDEKEKLAVDVTFNDNFTTPSVYFPKEVISESELSKQYGKTRRTTYVDGPMYTMTHRIFHADYVENAPEGAPKYYFFVAGINPEGHESAQNQYQVFTEDYLYGEVVGCSTFVGGLFRFAQSPVGLVILLLIPCLYMIISSVIDLFRSKDEELEQEAEKDAKEVATQDANDPLKGLTEKDRERLKKELLNKMMEEKQSGKKEEKK